MESAAARATPKKVVKKGIDKDDKLRKREEKAIAIRKEKREMGIEKRRKAPMEAPAAAADPAAPARPALELRLDLLSVYCDGALSADPARQFECVHCIRRLLSKDGRPPVEEVLKSGILPRLVELLGTPGSSPELQFEAAWAITNIASTEYTKAVVDAGAVGPLVNAMMSADDKLRDQAIWCLGNIAGDCARFRDSVINAAGAVNALLLNIQHPSNITLLRNATWTLSNLCRGKPTPSLPAVQTMIPALAYLIGHEDREVLQDAAWGLSYLTDGDEPTIQAVVDAGVAPRCVQLLGHPEISVQTPALRVVGNLISGSDRQTQAAVDAGALPALVPLISHSKKAIRREACWTISNVAAGTVAQISTLMAVPGMLAGVLEQLRRADWAVKKEAAWVASNIATAGNAEHVRALVAAGVAEPMVGILESIQDVRILCVVMDAVEAILKHGQSFSGQGSFADVFEEAGLLNALEEVQANCEGDAYDKAVHIIDTYYGRDDEAEEEGALAVAAPQQPAFGFAFGAPAGPLASNPAAANGGFSFGNFGAPAAKTPVAAAGQQAGFSLFSNLNFH